MHNQAKPNFHKKEVVNIYHNLFFLYNKNKNGMNIMQTSYADKTMICPQCGKEFILTVAQQSMFNRNAKRNDSRNNEPFCSKSCSGKYGKDKQIKQGIKRKSNKVKSGKIDVYSNEVLLQSFETFEDCSLFIQNEFNITKYRANEQIIRVLNGERQQYKGYVFKYG